jgi:hypothetical protein
MKIEVDNRYRNKYTNEIVMVLAVDYYGILYMYEKNEDVSGMKTEKFMEVFEPCEAEFDWLRIDDVSLFRDVHGKYETYQNVYREENENYIAIYEEVFNYLRFMEKYDEMEFPRIIQFGFGSVEKADRYYKERAKNKEQAGLEPVSIHKQSR